MINILIGDDRYAIESKICSFKNKINSRWVAFNYHWFDSSELEKAIYCSLTCVFGNGQKLVVVENCDFRLFGNKELSILQSILSLPPSNNLVLIANSFDKRLKVSKFLLKYAEVFEYNLIPPWRNDLIEVYILNQANKLNLRLDNKVLTYLSVAIGNDSFRINQELKKLSVYANGKSLYLKEVVNLIPNRKKTNLHLATALRQGNINKVVNLVNNLLTQAEYPLVIIATLITQFRTWLWIKVAIINGLKSNQEIAQLCNINNPKRIYFLKNEVKNVEWRSLCDTLTKLLDLEILLKNGANNNVILPSLLNIIKTRDNV